DAVRRVGTDVAVQGHMDPIALLLTEAKMGKRVANILSQAKSARGHVFNLGHGILPETPPAQAKLLVELVHKLSRR
ncbi:MAG: uroporphyrinogen decarboxylase family protein, partial [Deltaproteobacteria bacterium]